MVYELKGKRVYVAGHRGMVGSAIVRRLSSEDCEIVTADRASLDLKDQAAVRRWMADTRPDAVFLAAAKVGGILANDSFPADFLYDNLMIETNIIEAAHGQPAAIPGALTDGFHDAFLAGAGFAVAGILCAVFFIRSSDSQALIGVDPAELPVA